MKPKRTASSERPTARTRRAELKRASAPCTAEPAHFEQAASVVTKEMIADSMVCGPDIGAIVDRIRTAIDGGVDHVYVHQIGDDQEAFCKVWSTEIAPEVRRS